LGNIRAVTSGVHPIGIYLTGLHLTGMHLTSVHRIDMYPIGAYPISVDVTGIYFKGVHLLGVHLLGGHLMNGYLVGKHPMGRHLVGVHLMGIPNGRVSRSRVSHGRRPLGPKLLKTPPFLQGFACLTLMSPRASHVQVCSRKPGYGSVPSALFLPTLRRTIPARARTRTRHQTGLTVCRGYSLRTVISTKSLAGATKTPIACNHPTTAEGYISVNSVPIELEFEYRTVLYIQNLIVLIQDQYLMEPPFALITSLHLFCILLIQFSQSAGVRFSHSSRIACSISLIL
jgi:hypothetical protein